MGAELIKTHPRVAPGKRSTDPNDYPEHKRGYAMRSIDALLARAKERGEHVGVFAERLLGGPLPWTTMRQGHELVRLCDRYGDARVDVLCKRAMPFDVIDVPRIGRMHREHSHAAGEPASGVVFTAGPVLEALRAEGGKGRSEQLLEFLHHRAGISSRRAETAFAFLIVAIKSSWRLVT